MGGDGKRNLIWVGPKDLLLEFGKTEIDFSVHLQQKNPASTNGCGPDFTCNFSGLSWRFVWDSLSFGPRLVPNLGISSVLLLQEVLVSKS